MDPLNVEAADREFVRKLRQLRSKLADRQQAQVNRPLLRRRYLSALLLTSLVVIVVLGSYDEKRRQNGSPGAAGQSAAVNDPPPATRAALPALKTPTAPIPLIAAAAATFHEDGKAPRLASVVVCQGIRNREPVEANDRFDPAVQPRAYVWMEVYAEDPPVVIKHIYYHNGRKYCEVPLEIRYPRMRTWSYVTLGKPGLAGAWSVDVTLDGSVLKKESFRVGGGGLPGD